MANTAEKKTSQIGILELPLGTKLKIVRRDKNGNLIDNSTILTKGSNRIVSYVNPLTGITVNGTLTGTEEFVLVEQKEEEAPKLALVARATA